MCQRQDHDQQDQLRFSHAWRPDSDSAKQNAPTSANKRYQMHSAASDLVLRYDTRVLATLHRGTATRRVFLSPTSV